MGGKKWWTHGHMVGARGVRPLNHARKLNVAKGKALLTRASVQRLI